MNARARVRAQLIDEIKQAAREELGVSGSSGLSLRAVARRLEMAPSALYRYFDGRDALLTALIIDAYEALAAAAVAADEAARPSPLLRWLEVGGAVRRWAWEHPQEWGLIYGSPVPGYEAPQDTVGPAMELVRVFVGILLTVHGPGAAPVPLPVAPPVTAELERWLAIVRSPYLEGLPDAVAALAVLAYTHLLGIVSLELFGQFGPDATPAPAIFEYGLRMDAALLGLS
jgi:AcrR family transcriptional regulator